MSTILQFPSPEQLKEKKEELDDVAYLEYCERLIDISTSFAGNMYNIIWDELEEAEIMVDVDPDDVDAKEAQDVHVIANMICSMVMRYYGMEHHLHGNLDDAFVQLETLDNEPTNENEE